MLTVRYNPSVLHSSSKVSETVISTHFSVCVPKWQFGEISIGFLSSTQHRKGVPRGNQTPSFKQHKRDRKPLYLFRHKSSFRYNRLQDFNRWVGIRDKPLGWFHFYLLEKNPKNPYLIRICNFPSSTAHR